MKFVFTLLLISFSSVSFSQMTFNDIIKIYKMDMDQFEEYAIIRGYDFFEFIREDKRNGVSYTKGEGKETRYLNLCDIYLDYGKTVQFQTGVSSEILRIKTEIKKYGYKLYDSYFLENKNTKVDGYRNGKFELSIYTVPPGDESNNYVAYVVDYHRY